MSSGAVNLPLTGYGSWRAPVATSASLPASGNTLGDAIAAEDTGTVYIWTGSSWTSSAGGGGTGTVTSVALSAPASILSVSGSPVTTSGTLTLSLATQAANTVWSGPTTGAAANPTFRALVAADIPLISLTSGVSGILPVANGGTNSSAALNNNCMIISSAGSLVEQAAQTASRVLTTDTNGLPVASTVTTTTLGFLDATSSIQTQLNSKQASGNYITALTGDGTAAGPGSAALTFATVNANVGSFGSASASPNFTVNAKGLITAAGSSSIQIAESQVTNLVSDLAGKQPIGNYITALTGDIAASGPGSSAATIQAGAVSLAKMANLAANSIIGNNTGSPATPIALTVAQVNTLLGTVTNVTASSPLSSSGGATPNITITSPLPIANGGTAQATAAAARGSSGLNIDQRTTVADANYIILATDRYVAITSITASRTLTLPAASAVNAGQSLTIEDESGSVSATNTVVIQRAGSDAVNGGTSVTITLAYGKMVLISNGSNAWYFAATSSSVTTVGTIDSQSKSANAAVIAANTIYMQTADASNPGVMSTGTQTVAGAKTFTGNTLIANNAGSQATIGGSSSTAIHQVNGAVQVTTRTTTSNLTVDNTTSDWVILCNQSAGISITMPTPTNGRWVTVKDISGTANTNNITIVQHAAEKIENLAVSKVLQTNFGSWDFVADGTNWWMI